MRPQAEHYWPCRGRWIQAHPPVVELWLGIHTFHFVFNISKYYIDNLYYYSFILRFVRKVVPVPGTEYYYCGQRNCQIWNLTYNRWSETKTIVYIKMVLNLLYFSHKVDIQSKLKSEHIFIFEFREISRWKKLFDSFLT